jgi:hypothetical protein
MGQPSANFPATVWDGDTANPDRIGRQNEANVNPQDWDRIVSEVLATQQIAWNHENKLRIPYLFSQQWEQNQKTGLNTLGGGLTLLSGADTLSNGVPIQVTKNNSKLLFVINSAGDAQGTIKITGTRWSPLLGTKTAAFEEELVIDGVSLDNTTTTTNGTTKWDIENAFISSNYFQGTVDIETTDLNLTDVDVYSIWYYENPGIDKFTLDGVNLSGSPNNLSAAMDNIVYSVLGNEDGSQKISISPTSHIEILTTDVVDADGMLAYTRVGFTEYPGDSTPDNSGLFTNTAFYPGAQSYWESISLDIWVSLYYSQPQYTG